MNPVSLCIPRVFPNIGEARIRRIFDELFLGDIARIDIVPTSNERGEKFNRVFIHFDMFFRNENAQQALARLREGKEIKIIYDGPWFWKVSLYRKRETNHQKSGPRIEYDEPVVAALPIAPALSTPEPRQTRVTAQRVTARPQAPARPQAQARPQKPRVTAALGKNKNKYNNKNKPKPRNLDKDLEEGEIA